MGTALTEALPSPAVRRVMEQTFEAFTRSFAHAFQRALAAGELSATTGVEGLALVATSTLNTLSLRARTGATSTMLKQLATAAVDVICGAHPTASVRTTAPQTAKQATGRGSGRGSRAARSKS